MVRAREKGWDDNQSMKKIEIDLKYNYVSSKPSSVSWFDLYVNFFVSVVLVGAGRAPAGRPAGEKEVF